MTAQLDTVMVCDGLAAQVPSYMVPAKYVFLNELPMNANGKVDRQALPDPDRPASSNYVALRTEDERAVAEIFAEVLAVERVGVHDGFFDLGGHSLLATQVVSRLRKRHKIDIPIQSLFIADTVAGLAARVAAVRGETARSLGTGITPAGRDRPLPLSFAQERLWFLDRLAPGNPFYNVPFAMRLTGSLNTASLKRSLDEIVRRHEVLRTTFPEVDGSPVERIAAVLDLPLETTILEPSSASEQATEVERLVVEESKRPFDLSRGPLVRAGVLRLAEEEHVLLFTMHHIVADGWSIGVLVNEFAALYACSCRGEPSPLPDLLIQYADFAVWQPRLVAGRSARPTDVLVEATARRLPAGAGTGHGPAPPAGAILSWQQRYFCSSS